MQENVVPVIMGIEKYQQSFTIHPKYMKGTIQEKHWETWLTPLQPRSYAFLVINIDLPWGKFYRTLKMLTILFIMNGRDFYDDR